MQPKNDPSTIGRLTIAALLDGQIRISELFVAEGFRKNGLGTYLLERARIDLMDAFSQRGIHPQSVSGYQLQSTKPFWDCSLRMYKRFAESLFEANVVCEIHDACMEAEHDRYFVLTPLKS